MKLKPIVLLASLCMLLSTNVFAEIFRGIQPGSTMTDIRKLFPGAKITLVNTAWATEGESLYDVSGPGLPGSMKIKFNDISVVFKKVLENSTEEDAQENYKDLAISSDDSMYVEWVRNIPANNIPIERLISKYGPPERSGFSEDDFTPFSFWESKGVYASLTDNKKYVQIIDYYFTNKERCESYERKGQDAPEFCKKNPTPKQKKKQSL